MQNVSRALVSRLTVTFGGTLIQDTNGYDIYKIFDDLFLSVYERDEMLMEGIQSDKLCKVRANSGDKPTSGVNTENSLEAFYKMKYKINLDHQILTSSGIFYPRALDKDLIFELTLAPASQVVRGSDASKLVYNLKNIQLEYERIRSKQLADHATTAYTHGKMYAYDEVMLEKTVTFNQGTATDLNVLVNTQRRSLKGIQQITSIAKPFRENVAAIVLFYTPSRKTTKAIFEDYAGEITHDEYKELIAWLKERIFSHLVFSLSPPYGIETEI